MEPILPTPISLEGASAPENGQSSSAPNSETTANVVPERSHEAASGPANSATPIAIPPVQPLPQATATPDPGPTKSSAMTDDPQIADDIDVIEKEWVDKAKKIVSATKADPHQQEKEVSKLQADYLMKRYNKSVKLSE